LTKDIACARFDPALVAARVAELAEAQETAPAAPRSLAAAVGSR